MPLAAPGIEIESIQHLRLSEVPWEYYEQTLAIIGDGHTRVTYLRGEIEIMSPLPKHEKLEHWPADRTHGIGTGDSA